MATTVHVPASHPTPSDFGSFIGGSPRGVELEERLDRSLGVCVAWHVQRLRKRSVH